MPTAWEHDLTGSGHEAPRYHATDSRGAHLTLRAGGEKKTVPLPSVQQVQPYLPVLSTFSTAGKAKPLPSRTFCYVLTAAEHADKLQRRL